VTPEELNAANLPVRGATIFNWGTGRNPKGRICPPGDILHLLGVVEYLNTRRGQEGVDPFEAIRLTMPEQLEHFEPDADGNVFIRYPELMKDLDYRHFNLPSFVRLYLAGRDQAEDVDLARQWGVSATTISQYRKGMPKMHLDTLDGLIEGLIPKETSQEPTREMRNFLMFLRHRSYFEETMDVVFNDQNQTQGKTSLPSEYGVFLIPHDQSLRDLDLTRRINSRKNPSPRRRRFGGFSIRPAPGAADRIRLGGGWKRRSFSKDRRLQNLSWGVPKDIGRAKKIPRHHPAGQDSGDSNLLSGFFPSLRNAASPHPASRRNVFRQYQGPF
jgi:hypothetical protein